jgi:hypothetical protein
MPQMSKKPRATADADSMRSTMELVQEIVPSHQAWLDAPNAALGGRAPRELIGHPDEPLLRQIVLAYKYGVFA